MKTTSQHLSPYLFFVLSMVFCASAWANESAAKLHLRVVEATKTDQHRDASLKDLAKELTKKGFTGYRLRDSADLALVPGTTGQMQLPSGDWMHLKALSVDATGKARLQIEVRKLKFKTSVLVPRGATVAVGGLPAKSGQALLLAITHKRAGR